MPSLHSVRGLLIVVPALLPLMGCGSNIVRVTGTVQHKGKPVPNLIVNFVPDKGRPSWGVTDDQGAFTLSHDKKTPEAERGTYRVYLTYQTRNPKDDLAFQQGKLKLPAEMRAILAKYGKLKTTPLHYDITTDGQVIAIVLE